MFALLCKDEALEYVMSSEDNNGLQAWQLIIRAKTPRSTTTILNQLLEPQFASQDARVNLRKWNKEVKEYEGKTGEKLSDAIKRSVYMSKIAPNDVRQHLILNQSKMLTAMEMGNEIEDYCDAMEEYNKGDMESSGFVGAIKGDFKGKDKGKGKEGHKGKLHKGFGYQPREGEQRKFGGHCSWCWRLGHKEAQCWFKQEYQKNHPGDGKGQRKITEWFSGDNPKGVKDKGKGKSKAKKGKGKGKGKQGPPQAPETMREFMPPGGAPSDDEARGDKRQRVGAVTVDDAWYYYDDDYHAPSWESPWPRGADTAGYVFAAQFTAEEEEPPDWNEDVPEWPDTEDGYEEAEVKEWQPEAAQERTIVKDDLDQHCSRPGVAN